MERSMSGTIRGIDNTEYIHRLVNSFGMNELQRVLSSVNQNIFGSQRILRNRIFKTLNATRTPFTKQLEQIILKVHYSNQDKQQQRPQIKVVQRHNFLRYQSPSFNHLQSIPPIHNSIQSFVETTNQTIHFAHNLPFFRTIQSLLKPIHCKCNKANFFILNEFYHLTENRRDDNAKSLDFSSKKHKTQIILRLEQVGCTETVIGRFPSNIKVFVNNNVCELPLLTNPGITGITPWWLNVPIDLTKNTICKQFILNRLTVTWSNDPHTYVAGVFLSEKLTWEDLLEELKKRPVRSSEKTKEFIKNSMKNDGDLDVDSLIVTVKDPLAKQRMKLPARGVDCIHIHCFDAIQFLQMNEQKQTWACPICKKNVKFENIEIDQFFLNVIQSSNLSKECENIILFKDGTWTEYKTENNLRANNCPSSNIVEIILAESDEDNSNNDNVENKEIEPKIKHSKCNLPNEEKPEHIAETINLLKTNVNSSTKSEIVKNNLTPSASVNSTTMSNDKPGLSSLIGSTKIHLNNSKTNDCPSSNITEITLSDSDEDNSNNDNVENVENEEIEPKLKRSKCNLPKEEKPEHIAETINLLKTNVNSSTKSEIVKNNLTPSASVNSTTMSNDKPGLSSLIGSTKIHLNNSKTNDCPSSNITEITLSDSDEDNSNNDNVENVENEEIEPKLKRSKYNPPKEKKPEHIAETVNLLKKNVNSSTKSDLVKNSSTLPASDNSTIVINGKPDPSLLIGSTKIHLNNSKTNDCLSSNIMEITLSDSDEDNSNNDNVENEEIEPKIKRSKCNPPKEKKPEHIAETVNLLKKNVNSSTKSDFVKNSSTLPASDNSTIVINGKPDPSLLIGSTKIHLNNSKTNDCPSSNIMEITLSDSDKDNSNNDNVENEEIEPKIKRSKCNPPKEKKPEHIAETVNLLKKNVNSSTKSDLVKNSSTLPASIIMLNEKPGPSSIVGSSCMLNNLKLPNYTSTNIRSKSNTNQEKANLRPVICVITLD